MKKIPIAVAIVMAFALCTRKPDPALSSLVSGTVDPAMEEALTINYAGFLDSAAIDREGAFSIPVQLDKAGYGMIFFNDRLMDIYLEPGKNLELVINSSTFPDKIEFGGELGPVNRYLQLSRKLDKQSDIGSDRLYSMSTLDFAKFTDSIKILKEKLLNEFVERFQGIDKEFADNRRTDILYTWANQQLLYTGYYLILKNELPELPGDYHERYLAKINLNDSSLLESPMYSTFLENYLDYREAVYLEYHPEVEKLWFPLSVARFRVINEEFTDPSVKNQVLFNAMNDHLDNFGSDHLDSFITNFNVHCTNEEFRSRIEEKIKRQDEIARGQEATDMKFFDPEGNKVLLSDLYGSLLYVNFWASWSHPSIQEFPHWEALRKRFEGMDIRFVSVSMDFGKDRNKWKYIINKQDLGGTQLLYNQGSSVASEVYFINDLPRYFLIDSNGKIISTHAPYPSEDVEPVLMNLLEK